jgi:hypothetical protein
MNFRQTSILFGVVLVAGIVLLVMAFTGTDTNEETGGLLLTKLAKAKAESITDVELEKGDSKLVLKRTGPDAWAVAAPVSARADASAVDAVIRALVDLRPVSFPELSSDPARHGLDNPLKVTLRDKDGAAETVNFGEVTIGQTRAVVFVTTDTRTRPMAVQRSAVDALLKDAAKASGPAREMAKWTTDFRTKAVFAADPRTSGDDVTFLKLTRNAKDLALTRGKAGWEFAAPAGWGDAAASADAAAAPGTLTGVRPLLTGLVGLSAGTADDFLDAPADLTQYGLNPGNPERVRVELKLRDGTTQVAYLGKKADDKKDEKKDAFAPPAKVYVQLEGTPGVIRASATGLDGLAAVIDNPTPLRDRDLVRDDQKTRIDAVDVATGGQTVQLRKTGTDWKLVGGPNDPQTANQTAAKGLLDLVTQGRIVKDFPASNDANFAGPALQAEVKLYADAVDAGNEKEGPKLKAGVNPTVLQFGKKDANGVFVRRIRPDGSKADFVVPDKVKVGTDPAETDVVAAVTKTRFGYLDPALPSFSSLQATKLQISQGTAVKVEVVKDKTPTASDAAWKYAAPDPMKGQTADSGTVNDLLNLLATQQAGKFVRELGEPEKGKEKDVYAQYGLAAENPRLKVVVGVDAPAPNNERVYYLGNETDDKQSVFARVEGRPVVFTVPKGIVYDKFANPDLRDRTLVRFDPSKLQRIQIRGWKDATGGELLVREFRKEGGTWVAKQPPGFSIDPTKVDEFVRAVQGLRVKDFREGGEHPDYRIAPEQNGFEVTLDFDGADDIILSLGAEVEGGAARIARVVTVGTPQRVQIATVLPDALRSFRESAKSFAR